MCDNKKDLQKRSAKKDRKERKKAKKKKARKKKFKLETPAKDASLTGVLHRKKSQYMPV